MTPFLKQSENYTARYNCKDVHQNLYSFSFWISDFHFLLCTYLCFLYSQYH